MEYSSELASSVGSRICHDIISPLGAIGNGLELLSMGAATDGPEIELITQSVASASARLRAFRIAFGLSEHVTDLPQNELHEILHDLYAGGRFEIAWRGVRDLTRSEAKSGFLGLLCLESALPRGGTLEMDTRDALTLRGTGSHNGRDSACWDVLGGTGAMSEFEPARIHFPMLAAHLKTTGRTFREAWAPDQVMLTL